MTNLRSTPNISNENSQQRDLTLKSIVSNLLPISVCLTFGFSLWYSHIRRRSLSDKVFLEVLDECAGFTGVGVVAGAIVRTGDVLDMGRIGLCKGTEAGGLLSDGLVI